MGKRLKWYKKEGVGGCFEECPLRKGGMLTSKLQG
jgi:hypothetical protein